MSKRLHVKPSERSRKGWATRRQRLETEKRSGTAAEMSATRQRPRHFQGPLVDAATHTLNQARWRAEQAAAEAVTIDAAFAEAMNRSAAADSEKAAAIAEAVRKARVNDFVAIAELPQFDDGVFVVTSETARAIAVELRRAR